MTSEADRARRAAAKQAKAAAAAAAAPKPEETAVEEIKDETQDYLPVTPIPGLNFGLPPA